MTKISVVLPAYNASKTLETAIDSVLSQTYFNFELLIINDGSSDTTEEIILRYSDERIVYIKNSKNLGLISTLNLGIERSSGVYIARMDADDIMHPQRLAHQIEFLEKNPSVALCGSSCRLFNSHGIIGKQYYGICNDELKAEMLFNSPVCHPSVLIRREVILEYKYNHKYVCCEDYDLWTKLLLKYEGYNLPLLLMDYRLGEGGQTQDGEKKQQQRFELISEIQNRLLNQELKIDNDEYYRNLHYILSLSSRIKEMSLQEYPIEIINAYLRLIYFNNIDSKYCVKKYMGITLGKIWLKIICFKFTTLSIKAFGIIFSSKFSLWALVYLVHRLYAYKR